MRDWRGADVVDVGCGTGFHLPRFAYFLGPGREAGVAECRPVLRPGGAMYVVDNDLRHGTFASWLARSPWAPQHSADEVESFWAGQGFSVTPVPSRWEFDSRADLERVVRIEFPPALAEELLAEHGGVVVEYHYALSWWLSPRP